MNIALWIASGLLAFAMLAAGGTKLFVPRVKLLDKMGWAASWSDGRVKLLGLAQLLGAIGVIVPHATGITPRTRGIASSSSKKSWALATATSPSAALRSAPRASTSPTTPSSRSRSGWSTSTTIRWPRYSARSSARRHRRIPLPKQLAVPLRSEPR